MDWIHPERVQVKDKERNVIKTLKEIKDQPKGMSDVFLLPGNAGEILVGRQRTTAKTMIIRGEVVWAMVSNALSW